MTELNVERPTQDAGRAFKFVNPIRAFRERQAELKREIKESAENLAALKESRALLVGALEKLEEKNA